MKISIFKLILIIVILFDIGIVLLWCGQGNHSHYVNIESVFLTIILSVIVSFQLSDAKKNNNYLILLLDIWLVSYVIFRILTLLYTDYSGTFEGHNVEVYDLEIGLIVTISCSLIMWGGLHFTKSSKKKASKSIYRDTFNHKKVLLFFWISIFVSLLAKTEIPIIGSLSQILTMYVFYPNAAFYVFSIFVMCNWKSLNKPMKIASILSFIVFALLLTLGGSRAGLVVVLKAVLYVYLALEYTNIKLKYLIVGSCLIPILIAFFVFSTYMRKSGMNKDVSVNEKIELIDNVYRHSESSNLKEIIAPVCERIGYIDYMTVYIKHNNIYDAIVNIPTETKSIVDNVLSPGFDLFDQPRVSVAATPWYENNIKLRKSNVVFEDYNSTEFTFFAETYVLFGFPLFFIVIYCISLLFRTFWKRFAKSETQFSILNKTLILYFFDVLLASFGFDWFAFDIVCVTISVTVFLWFASKKRNKQQMVILPNMGHCNSI